MSPAYYFTLSLAPGFSEMPRTASSAGTGNVVHKRRRRSRNIYSVVHTTHPPGQTFSLAVVHPAARIPKMSSAAERAASEVWLMIFSYLPDLPSFFALSSASKRIHKLAFGEGTKVARQIIANQFDDRVLAVAFVAIKAHEPLHWVRRGGSLEYLVVPRDPNWNDIRHLAKLDAVVDDLCARFVEYVQLPAGFDYRGAGMTTKELLRVKSAMYRIQVLCSVTKSSGVVASDYQYMAGSEPWEYEQMMSIREWMEDQVRSGMRQKISTDPTWGLKMRIVRDSLNVPIARGLIHIHRLMTSNSYWDEIGHVWGQTPDLWSHAWKQGSWWMTGPRPQGMLRAKWHPDIDRGPTFVWSWTFPTRPPPFGLPVGQNGMSMNLRTVCRRWGCFFWGEDSIEELICRGKYGLPFP